MAVDEPFLLVFVFLKGLVWVGRGSHPLCIAFTLTFKRGMYGPICSFRVLQSHLDPASSATGQFFLSF